MATIPLDIQIRVEHGGDVKRAIKGVTKEVTQAQREATRDSTRQNRERKRSSERAERDILRSKKESIREQRRLEREKHRDAIRNLNQRIRQTRRETQEFKKQSREKLRTIRSETKAMEQASRDRRRRLAQFGAAAVAGAAIGRGVVNRAESYLGLSTPEQRTQDAIEFTKRFTIVTNQANIPPAQRPAIQENILRAAEQNQRTPLGVLGGLQEAQATFDRPTMFTKNINAFSKFAFVLESSERELVRATGAVVKKFTGLTDDDIPEILALLKQSADRGMIEAGDIATSFAPRIAQFASVTGRRDIKGAREAFALFQLAGGSLQNKDEVETSVKNFLNTVIKEGGPGGKFEALGITGFRDKSGQIDVNTLINKLADSPLGQLQGTPLGNQLFLKTFTNIRGQETARALIAATLAAREKGDKVTPFEALVGTASSARVGEATANAALAEFNATKAGEASALEARGRAEAVRRSAEVLSAATSIARPKQEFQSKHPLVSEGVNTVMDNLNTIIGLGIFAKLFGRGKKVSAVRTMMKGAVKSPAGALLGAAALAGTAAYLGGPFLESQFGDETSAEASRQKKLRYLGLGEPIQEQTKELSQSTSEQTDVLAGELRNIADKIDRQNSPSGGYVGPWRQ